MKDWILSGKWDGQGTLSEHFGMNICYDFRVQDLFIAFVPLPAHPHSLLPPVKKKISPI